MEQAKLSEANYPETLRRVFIINGKSTKNVKKLNSLITIFK